MAVMIHDTPSGQIVRAANAVTTVTDSLGRAIGVKKIGALDRMKMFEVCGPENSKNEAYLGYAALAFSVATLDGEPYPRPATRNALEGLIKALGDEGLEAVAKHFTEQAGAEGQG